METSFFQKIALAIIAGFFAACLVYFYRHVVVAGNDAVNKNYKDNYHGAPGSRAVK